MPAAIILRQKILESGNKVGQRDNFWVWSVSWKVLSKDAWHLGMERIQACRGREGREERCGSGLLLSE